MSLVSHTLAFDDAIEGTTSVYTSADLNGTLGVPDRLLIVVFATQVTAASGTPTFTLQIEMSPDERNWMNVERFRLQLGVATSPRARIQVWVTGRDNVT
jgi:hypothetical protein